MPKKTMTVRVEPETRKALDAIATALGRDRSNVVNEALAAYVETYRWNIQRIRQGLREADAGRFASEKDAKKDDRPAAAEIVGRTPTAALERQECLSYLDWALSAVHPGQGLDGDLPQHAPQANF